MPPIFPLNKSLDFRLRASSHLRDILLPLNRSKAGAAALLSLWASGLLLDLLIREDRE